MSTDDDYRDMKPQGEWVEYVGISDNLQCRMGHYPP